MKLVINLKLEDAEQWLCQRRMGGERHRQTTSIRENSIIIGMGISFPEFLTIAYFWFQDYPPSMAHHEVKASKPTFLRWYKIFREITCDSLERNHAMIGGPGTIVEIDESKFGKRKYHWGRVVPGCWVFGRIQRDNPKNVFMVTVEKRDEATLLPIIRKFIRPGTTIISDCWKAYTNLERNGYMHLTVNHLTNFVEQDTGAHTNLMEGSWHLAKRSLPAFGTSHENIAAYLGSFLWRRRHSDKDRFVQLLREIKEVYPMENA